MKYNKPLSELQNDKYYLAITSQELDGILDSVGFPKKWYNDITGAVVLIGDGDYIAVWLTESPAYYELSAVYHPLPYYRPSNWKVKYLPYYWHKWNIEYR